MTVGVFHVETKFVVDLIAYPAASRCKVLLEVPTYTVEGYGFAFKKRKESQRNKKEEKRFRCG